jgi:hypothetical protein
MSTTATEPEVVAPVIVGDDDLAVFTQPIEIWRTPTPTRQLVDELPAIGRRLAAWARRSLATARAATAWISAGVDDAAAPVASWRRRARYRGRHHVASYWFGRERSTAEQTGYAHRTYRLQVARDRTLTIEPSPEGELPGRPTESIYWVGWIERWVEIMRCEQDALHPATRHRFICS